ncbi:MAG TPA: hypothetical protein VFB30_11650 [Spirochaetia bacterium]|nr:hypothetical protein [Spirochaetia bacterium]
MRAKRPWLRIAMVRKDESYVVPVGERLSADTIYYLGDRCRQGDTFQLDYIPYRRN